MSRLGRSNDDDLLLFLRRSRNDHLLRLLHHGRRGAYQYTRIAPVSLDEHIMIPAHLPTRRNPQNIVARRDRPVARDPDMPVAAPGPVSGHPDVRAARPLIDHFALWRRWRGCDDDLRRRR